MTRESNGNGHDNGNSNGAFYKWVTALLTSLLMFGFSWSITRISALEVKAAQQEERVLNLVTTLNEVKRNQEETMTFLRLQAVAKTNPEVLDHFFPPRHP